MYDMLQGVHFSQYYIYTFLLGSLNFKRNFH